MKTKVTYVNQIIKTIILIVKIEKNNCMYCEKDHDKHNMFPFGTNIPNKDNLEKKIN